jgi:hypothetical protein
MKNLLLFFLNFFETLLNSKGQDMDPDSQFTDPDPKGQLPRIHRFQILIYNTANKNPIVKRRAVAVPV